MSAEEMFVEKIKDVEILKEGIAVLMTAHQEWERTR